MNRIKSALGFLAQAGQSRTTAFLVLLVIGAAIPLTVLVAQRQQSYQQKAAQVCNGPFCGRPGFDCIDKNCTDDDTCIFAVGAQTSCIPKGSVRNGADCTNVYGGNDLACASGYCRLDKITQTTAGPLIESVCATQGEIDKATCDRLCNWAPGIASACHEDCLSNCGCGPETTCLYSSDGEFSTFCSSNNVGAAGSYCGSPIGPKNAACSSGYCSPYTLRCEAPIGSCGSQICNSNEVCVVSGPEYASHVCAGKGQGITGSPCRDLNLEPQNDVCQSGLTCIYGACEPISTDMEESTHL